MEPMLVKFRENTEKFIDFMMRFELNLELPDPNRSWVSMRKNKIGMGNQEIKKIKKEREGGKDCNDDDKDEYDK